MSVNTQVSGNKITVIQASKNLGTVINNQASGKKIDARFEYRKITDVKPTQLGGQMRRTNYMGINDEGMDIFAAKKVDEHFYHQNQYSAQDDILKKADIESAKQEADKKKKYKKEVVVTPTPTEPEAANVEFQDAEG